MPKNQITITATGDKAVVIMEHIVNPALKDCMVSVRWDNYPDKAEITAEFNDDDLAFVEAFSRAHAHPG